MLVLLLLGVGGGAVLFSFYSPSKLALERNQKTAAALAQAKDALIGRAATDNNRPGSLPCPDTDNDGSAELFAGNNCPSYVGRLPWRTLGIPDLRDGSGEMLWYALSPNFRDHPSAGPLNSDTAGQLLITGASPANNVIAIVFAPGAAVGNQIRDNVISLCQATATNIANNLCPTNYLDGENGNGMPPTDINFTTAQASDSFNDKLLAITSDALFPVVEYRVARQIRANLAAYFAANNYYPFASNYGDTTFSCVPGLTRGRLPRPGVPDYSISASAGCGAVADWTGIAQQPPSWFTVNNWHELTYYTVAPACTNTTLNCAGAGFLTVNNTQAPINDKQALVIIAGRALTGQSRPCASVADCLEDPENTNLDDVYVKNAISPTFNDKFVIVAP